MLLCFLGINYQKNIDYSKSLIQNNNYDLLNKTSTTIDVSLEHLSTIAQTIFKDSDVISACVAPNSSRTTRSFSVRKTLENYYDNPLIQDIYLYTTYDQMIYAPNLEVCHVSNLPLMAELLNSQNVSPLDSLPNSYLFNHQGQAFFLQDFPLSGDPKIATLVLQLNENTFSDLIRGSTQNSLIYVYDAFGNPIFTYNIKKTSSQMKEILLGAYNATGNYILFNSEVSPLTYVYESTVSAAPTLFSYLLENYVVFFSLFFLAFFCALIIAHSLYMPLLNLIKSLPSHLHNPTQNALYMSKNELDYLYRLLTSHDVQLQQTGSHLRELLSELETRLLDDMLKNTMSEQDIQTYLSNINSPLGGKGYFLAAVIGLSNPDMLSSIHDIFQKETQLIHAANSDEHLIYATVIADTRLAIVFKWTTHPSESEIKYCSDYIYQLFDKHLKFPNDTHFQIELSNIKNEISAFPIAYAEASQKLLMRNITSLDVNHVEQLNQSSSADLATQLFNQITTFILSNSQENPELFIKKLWQSLLISLPPINVASAVSELFSLMKRKLCQHDIPHSSIFSLIPAHPTNSQELDQLASMMELAITEYINCTLPIIHNKKSRNVYLAKEYIFSNYSNSSLSLGDVAKSLGTSVPNLSSQFTACGSVKFSECLRNCRIEAAQKLLIDSDISVREIGEKCGFNSTQNFHRVFKQHLDVSPGEYRKSFQLKQGSSDNGSGIG